jgi:hypothetical protein
LQGLLYNIIRSNKRPNNDQTKEVNQMQLEDVVLQVVEQQVQDWCAHYNWEIKEITDSHVTMVDKLEAGMTLNVVIPGIWMSNAEGEPEERELKVVTERLNIDTLISGYVGEQRVFGIPLRDVDVETTGPCTNW